MLIDCPNCRTKFKLDDSLLPPEGAWLRCSRCQEEFFTPRQEEEVFPPPLDTPRPDGPGISFDHAALADFGLNEPPEAKPKSGGLFRKLLILILILIIIGALGLGALLALDRLNMAPQLVNYFRGLPYLDLILTPPEQDSGVLSLNNVRAYFRDNSQAGRLFVIQGEVVNLSQQTQSHVLVQGQLNDIYNQPARQAVIYAGPLFTLEELHQLTLTQIQSKLSQPFDQNGQAYLLPPQGSLPFMIVLANPPDDAADYTAYVAGWEAVTP